MVYVFYRPETEYTRKTEQFLERLEDNNVEYETFNPDELDGSAKSQVYDLWQYPAVVALGPAGSPQKTWSGTLPTVSDVAYFSRK